MASQEPTKNPPPSTDSLNQELENNPPPTPPKQPQPPLSDSEDTAANPPDNENTILLPLKKRHQETAGALITGSDKKKSKMESTTSNINPEKIYKGSLPNDYVFSITSRLLMGIHRFRITTGIDPIDKEECMEDIIELLGLDVTVERAMLLVNSSRNAYESGGFDVFGHAEQDWTIYNRAKLLWGDDQSNCSEIGDENDKMYVFFDVYTDRNSQGRAMEIVLDNQRDRPLKVDTVGTDALVDVLIGNLGQDLPLLAQNPREHAGSSDLSSYVYPDRLAQPSFRPLKINDSDHGIRNRAGPRSRVNTESPYLLRLRRNVDTQIGLFRAIIAYRKMHQYSPFKNSMSAKFFLFNWLEVDDEPESMMAPIEDLRAEHQRRANSIGMDLGILRPLEREAFVLAQRVFGFYVRTSSEAEAVSSQSCSIDESDTNPSASDKIPMLSEAFQHDQSPGISDDVIRVNPTPMQSEDVNRTNPNLLQSANPGYPRNDEEPTGGPSNIELMEGLVGFINNLGINPLEQDDPSLIEGLISERDWKIPVRKFCDKFGEIKVAYEARKTAGLLGSPDTTPEEKKMMNLAARVWGDKDGASS